MAIRNLTTARLHLRDRRTLVWLTALIALLVVILGVWGPFGLRRAAWGDAWGYYGGLLSGVTLAPLPNSRPLNWLPWVVSYHLTPTSFLGMNLLIATLMLVKGVLVYAITRQLAPRAAGLALSAALLAVIYPAEVGYFFDGFINLHQGFNAYLLAVFFLLAYWKRHSIWFFVAAIAALAFSVFTYEAVLALAVGTPLLLLFLERRITRRLVWTALIWWTPVAVYLIYIAVIRLSIGLNAREAGLLSSGLNVPNLPLELVQANLWNLGQRFVEGWREAVTLSPFGRNSPLFWIALITGALTVPLVLAHTKLAHRLPVSEAARWPARRWVELAALGLVWTVLGYAVFSLASVRYEGWRLGFYTVLGSSLTVALVLYGATAHRRVSWLLALACAVLAVVLLLNRTPVGLIALAGLAAVGFALPRPLNLSVVLGVLLTIGISRQLDILRWQTGESLAVQQLMTWATDATPGLQPGTPVLLVLEAVHPDDVPFDTSGQFEAALDLIHGDPGYIGVVCPLGLAAWGFDDESCTFGDAGVTVVRNGQTQTLPYDSLVAITAGADGVVRLAEQLPAAWGVPDAARYAPWARLDRSAPRPPGFEELFNPRPLIDR